VKKRIRIQGMLIVFTILAVFFLHKFLLPHWKDERIDKILDILGVGFILTGFLFRVSARGYKEENSLSGKALVMDGPYALMRNPMYFGTLLIGTGFIAVLLEWWALPLFLLIFILIYTPQVSKEEAVLTQRFGRVYTDYCKETPRYLPRFSRLFSLRRYLRLKPSWLKMERQSLAAAMICLMVIEAWEDFTLFGWQELLRKTLELALTIAVFALTLILLFRNKEK
jgi:protein-S-isoprenylcysteine O-methyltransferase Ste14